jgi:hypothetical protein
VDVDHVHGGPLRGRIERWCSDLGGAPLDEYRLDELLAFVEDANGGPAGDDIAVLALSSSTMAHNRG